VATMDETVKKLKSAYDAVAYVFGAYFRTHPEQIAVAAALRGITAPNVECCRVLEIGCATGSNLIPMAEQLPGSRFLGIDLSERQIETGSNIVRELELTNIELRCQDIMEFPDDAGQFDYIIAHGVYSWVPPVVQEKLLAICHAHLAQRGMALVTYNAYPGWRLKEVTREMMLYHARGATDPAESLALGRQMVQFVRECTPVTTFFRDMVQDHEKRIAAASERYVIHDHMEVVNDPRYFWQFMKEAMAHGLAYVGESSADPNYWLRISDPARETIRKMSTDQLEREQYIDFLVNRTFRSTVLCRSEAAPDAASPASSRIRDVYVAGNPSEAPAGTDALGRASFKFETGDKQITLSAPSAIAILRHLRSRWPAAVPFSELLSAFVDQAAVNSAPNKTADAVERLIEAYHDWRLVELWSRPSGIIATAAGAHPSTTRYARWQASHNQTVTSLRHSPAKLDVAFRDLIPLVDGTRDRKALAEEIVRRSEAGTAPAWPHKNREELDGIVDSALNFLANSRLILKES